MAFTLQLQDPIPTDVAQRAQAGMALLPQDDGQALPAVGSAIPQPKPYQPSGWDILQGVLFDSQSPAQAAMAARARNYQANQMQLMQRLLPTLPPDELKGVLLGGPFAQRLNAFALKGGETGVHMGAGGSNITAPVLGFDDKSGKGYAVGAGGVTSTGGQVASNGLGGDFTAKDGLILSNRTGDVANTYATPVTVAPGSTAVPFTSGVGGGASGPAVVSGGPTPSSAPQGAPRGIRNNNFGNVKTPPQGPWAGQTGVDDQGHAIFADPADGVRAARMNLQSYAAEGVSTPAAIAAKWKGVGDATAYGKYLAGRLGVKPMDQINLGDPGVQQQVLRGIFDFENGPAAMAGWRGGKPLAQAKAGGGFGAPIVRGQQPYILDPADPANADAYRPFPKGTVLQVAADGTKSVVQKPEYSPEAKTAIRDHVLGSKEYNEAQAAMTAYKAMIGNADKMTGPSAYSMLDTFARAINPGAVARPTVIQTIEQNLGLPAQFVGSLESKFGQGNLPPQVRQQILDAVIPFAQAHWDAANMLNNANAALAKQHDFDPADVTAPLDARPERFSLTVPPATQRAPGLYSTPKGPLRWTGTGWVKP